MVLSESLRIASPLYFGGWPLILGLIFGGCCRFVLFRIHQFVHDIYDGCSNAWALELAASQNRNAGSLITLAQFLLVSLSGLPKHLCIVTTPASHPDVCPNLIP